MVPARTAVPIPEEVPFRVGALLGCGATTGLGAVFNTAGVEPGASVAVFGCGGVGMSALLAADTVGAAPLVAVDVDGDTLETASELGATETVRADRLDPVERVTELTGGGADYTFECSGRIAVMESAIAATREGGTATLVGAHHGEEMVTLDPRRDLLPGGKTIKGCVVGSVRPAVDIPRYARMYRRSALPLDALVTETIPLESVNRAFDAPATGGIRTVVSLN